MITVAELKFGQVLVSDANIPNGDGQDVATIRPGTDGCHCITIQPIKWKRVDALTTNASLPDTPRREAAIPHREVSASVLEVSPWSYTCSYMLKLAWFYDPQKLVDNP